MSTGYAGEPQWIDNTADTHGQEQVVERDSGYAIILIQGTKSSGLRPRLDQRSYPQGNAASRGLISTRSTNAQDIPAMSTAISPRCPQCFPQIVESLFTGW
jgi:hypothetical protein